MSEPLQWLVSRAPDHLSDINAVRQFFSRLGGLVSARFAVEQRGRALEQQNGGA